MYFFILTTHLVYFCISLKFLLPRIYGFQLNNLIHYGIFKFGLAASFFLSLLISSIRRCHFSIPTPPYIYT